MTSVAIPEVYDPALGTWSDPPALPAARHNVAGFAYQDMACVAGGKFPYTARVDCIYPTSRTWHRLADLPDVTSGAGAVTLGGHPVVVGGEGNAVVPWLFSLIGATWQRQEMLLPRHGIEVAVLNDRAWVCGGGTVCGAPPNQPVHLDWTRVVTPSWLTIAQPPARRRPTVDFLSLAPAENVGPELPDVGRATC